MTSVLVFSSDITTILLWSQTFDLSTNYFPLVASLRPNEWGQFWALDFSQNDKLHACILISNTVNSWQPHTISLRRETIWLPSDCIFDILRAPGIRVKLFHGSNKNERERNLHKVQRRTGVCLTTYGKMIKFFICPHTDNMFFPW